MEEEKKLERVVEQLKEDLKADIKKIIYQSPIEDGIGNVKNIVYKMYEEFLSNSAVGRGIALDNLIIGKNNLDKYLEREFEDIKREKADRTIRMIENFEDRREEKYEWSNLDKRREKSDLEAEYKNDREYTSKVNKWIERIQENLEEIEKIYKKSCDGYGSMTVSLFNQELITVIQEKLNWNDFEIEAIQMMSKSNDKVIRTILDRYEEYAKLVEKANKDTNLETELICKKRAEFVKNMRVPEETVDVRKAVDLYEEKVDNKEKDDMILPGDIL